MANRNADYDKVILVNVSTLPKPILRLLKMCLEQNGTVNNNNKRLNTYLLLKYRLSSNEKNKYLN